MKKVIALYGRANCGKSTTIKRVADELLKLYPEAKVEWINSKVDITLIVVIKGVVVGIESQGDPCSRLETSIPMFKARGCHIILCAARTWGMTNDWIKTLEPEYEVEWVKQDYTNEHEVSNSKMALGLLDRITGSLG